MPSLREEKKLWQKGYKIVVCLDEAGRGALAGPVVAAAVTTFFPRRSVLPDIKDSKKLSVKKREEIYKILTKGVPSKAWRVVGGWRPATEWAIGRVSEKVIDKINILEATKLAMIRAVRNLEKKLLKHPLVRTSKQINFLILDGKMKLDLPIPQKSIVKADEKVFSCAIASILAKVTRDRIMIGYHNKYPRYRFDLHKGYPTKLHQRLLKKYGSCRIYRKSFGPVKACKLK